METLEKNLSIIEADIKAIQDQLGENIARIGLFGSCLNKDIQEVNDIDLVIYSKSQDISFFKKELSRMKLNYPIRPQKINGTYGMKHPSIPGLHYHIIILDAEKPNKYFEEINVGKIRLLDKH